MTSYAMEIADAMRDGFEMDDETMEEEMGSEYEVLDGCRGTVTGISRKGAFLTLDNGQTAYAPGYSNLREGVRALCAVLKGRSELHRDLLVVIESVEYAA